MTNDELPTKAHNQCDLVLAWPEFNTDATLELARSCKALASRLEAAEREIAEKEQLLDVYRKIVKCNCGEGWDASLHLHCLDTIRAIDAKFTAMSFAKISHDYLEERIAALKQQEPT